MYVPTYVDGPFSVFNSFEKVRLPFNLLCKWIVILHYPFLDVLVECDEGLFITRIYCSPTFTQILLSLIL